MVMVVEIVSQQLIKPTSPTPLHLRTHKLSFMDQFYPPVYIPTVLFYMNQETGISSADTDSSNTKNLQLLKESLAQTLTLFYPFAGRIKDELCVDCNDEGAYYVEARVNCPLAEFLKLNDFSYVSKLLPNEASWSAEGYAAMIQVTTFECGGIVIGANLSHLIGDGPAAMTFISSWAAATRKHDNSKPVANRPNFDASFVFPQNIAYPVEATICGLFSPFMKKRMCRLMRIVFDASAIASLKAKIATPSVPNPTRVEAISALLSKCIMATSEAKSNIRKPTLAVHAVNLRGRAVPKFSKYSMGNFVYLAAVQMTPNETELGNLVCKIRKGIREVDSDFVSALQGDGGWVTYCEHMKEIGKALSGAAEKNDFLAITSWCNFGAYETDFGWGKPTWVTYLLAKDKSEAEFANAVVLMDTKAGNGIEAMVFLEEQRMVMLEQNEELLVYGSLEQSPLN